LLISGRLLKRSGEETCSVSGWCRSARRGRALAEQDEPPDRDARRNRGFVSFTFRSGEDFHRNNCAGAGGFFIELANGWQCNVVADKHCGAADGISKLDSSLSGRERA
jgi:hypothetical protein